MNKTNVMIWGRKFELDITYDCYSGEKVLKSQKDAVTAFSKADEAINSSLDRIKEYCLSHNRRDIVDGKIENIFKYVVPKYLYVVREEGKHIVSIMCNYKFDIENGIAVVFENEQFKEIGKQDIIL